MELAATRGRTPGEGLLGGSLLLFAKWVLYSPGFSMIRIYCVSSHSVLSLGAVGVWSTAEKGQIIW